MESTKEIDGQRATSVVISAAVGFICLFSASPAAADDTPIAIANRIVAQFVDGYNRRDASALESLYSSNAMLLPMGHPEPVMGEEEIHAYFETVMKQMPPPNYKIERSELILLGPKEMVQGGTWSSDTLHTSGTYLAVMGKVGEDPGEWKLIASTWNAVPEPGLPKDASNSSAPTQSGTSTPDK